MSNEKFEKEYQEARKAAIENVAAGLIHSVGALVTFPTNEKSQIVQKMAFDYLFQMNGRKDATSVRELLDAGLLHACQLSAQQN